MDSKKIEIRNGPFVVLTESKAYCVSADRSTKTIEFSEVQNLNDWTPHAEDEMSDG